METHVRKAKIVTIALVLIGLATLGWFAMGRLPGCIDGVWCNRDGSRQFLFNRETVYFFEEYNRDNVQIVGTYSAVKDGNGYSITATQDGDLYQQTIHPTRKYLRLRSRWFADGEKLERVSDVRHAFRVMDAVSVAYPEQAYPDASGYDLSPKLSDRLEELLSYFADRVF